MVPGKAAIGAQGVTKQTTYDASNASQLIAAIFDAEMLGIAIFDRQHRFVAVNEALASLHGIPAKDHVGKALREVFPQASPKAESLINHVFQTGERVLNAEITAQLPTRNAPGHWIVNFVPIKDEREQVSQVGAIAFEATHQVMLAECLRSLMNRLPQVRDQVSWAFVSSQKQAVDPSLLAQSAEKLEQCVQAMQELSGLVEAIASSPSAKDEDDSRQATLPYIVPTAPFGKGHSAPAKAPKAAVELAPREVEVVTLLAAGRSNKEISTILKITVKTVETYRERIMTKLQIHSMNELVVYAIRNKLLHV
jgi:DNA-binding NarL/FixJ family response regulator